MNVSRKFGFLAVALVVVPTLHTSAAIIAYEGFDYTTSTTVNGANGGSGWGGAWATTNNTNNDITYAFQAQDIDAPTSDSAAGNQLFIDPGAANDDAGGATPDISRDFASTIDTNVDQTIYISALYRREDVTNINGSENSQPIRFNTASGARVVTVGHSSTEDLEIVYGTGPNNTGNGDFMIDTDYLIVAKFDMNTAGTADVMSVTLFEDGDTLSEPVTWQLTASEDLSDVIAEFQIGTTRRGGRAFIDEIKIGDSFADVIPEPGSLSLIGTGLGLLLMRRRNA